MPLSQTLNLLNKDRKATEEREIDEILGVVNKASEYTREFRKKKQVSDLADADFIKNNSARITSDIKRINPDFDTSNLTANQLRNADDVITRQQTSDILKEVKDGAGVDKLLNIYANETGDFDGARALLDETDLNKKTSGYAKLRSNKVRNDTVSKLGFTNAVSGSAGLDENFTEYLQEVSVSDESIERYKT